MQVALGNAALLPINRLDINSHPLAGVIVSWQQRSLASNHRSESIIKVAGVHRSLGLPPERSAQVLGMRVKAKSRILFRNSQIGEDRPLPRQRKCLEKKSPSEGF